MNDMNVSAIASLIKSKDNFIIISHITPDGDCIGSMIGLHLLCKALGKVSVMVNADEIPASYHFLPCVDEIRTTPPKGQKFQVALVVDSATLERLGAAQKFLEDVEMVVNIDHHKSNEGFGHMSLIRSEASASGEIIFDIATALGQEITPELATVLFTAISTDTGSFKFSNTTGRTFNIAAELVERGAKPAFIAESVFESKPYSTLKLLGDLLTNLKISPCGQVAWILLPSEKLKDFKVAEEQTEGFVNYARMVDGVKVALLLRQRDNGEIRVSWRSKGKIDVSNLASAFGGGGHAKAAGCIIYGKTLQEAEQAILDVVYDVL